MRQLNLFEQIHSSSVLSTMNTIEKVTHQTNITASLYDCNWDDDDLYEDILDFDVTDQSWRTIAGIF